eukprot:TRINITY_DN36966_c0_g1_i1.p1 TRINITY_DN36966_c0_g1~~TRINITY_DN36966_c0_g1_i1.p1  ORF type:complete len:533 (+),score=100.81 TRINITY_DN36966_c0_g1_i1:37-1599(+)
MTKPNSELEVKRFVVYKEVSHPSGGVSKQGTEVFGVESSGVLTLSCCGKSIRVVDDVGNHNLVCVGVLRKATNKQLYCPLKQYFPTHQRSPDFAEPDLPKEISEDILSAYTLQLSRSISDPDPNSDPSIDSSLLIFKNITKLEDSCAATVDFKAKLKEARFDHITEKKQLMASRIHAWREAARSTRLKIRNLLKEPIASAVMSSVTQRKENSDPAVTEVGATSSLRKHRKVQSSSAPVNKPDTAATIPTRIVTCLGVSPLGFEKGKLLSLQKAGAGGVATAFSPPPSQGAVAGISPCIGVSAAVLGGLTSLRLNMEKHDSQLVIHPLKEQTMWGSVIKPSLSEAGIAAVTATGASKVLNTIPHHHKQSLGAAAATSFAICSAAQAAYDWNRSALSVQDLSKKVTKAALGIGLSLIPKPIGTTITVAAMSSDLIGWTDLVVDSAFGTSSWQLRCSLIQCFAAVIGVSPRCSDEDMRKAYKPLRMLLCPSSGWGGTSEDAEFLDAVLLEILLLRSSENVSVT